MIIYQWNVSRIQICTYDAARQQKQSRIVPIQQCNFKYYTSWCLKVLLHENDLTTAVTLPGIIYTNEKEAGARF